MKKWLRISDIQKEVEAAADVFLSYGQINYFIKNNVPKAMKKNSRGYVFVDSTAKDLIVSHFTKEKLDSEWITIRELTDILNQEVGKFTFSYGAVRYRVLCKIPAEFHIKENRSLSVHTDAIEIILDLEKASDKNLKSSIIEQAIIDTRLRTEPTKTLAQIAEEYGISRSAVHQRELRLRERVSASIQK